MPLAAGTLWFLISFDCLDSRGVPETWKKIFYRLLEVLTNRIVDILPPEKPVSELYPQRVYRVEVSGQTRMLVIILCGVCIKRK